VVSAILFRAFGGLLASLSGVTTMTPADGHVSV
jgi:hypothetical protein